MLILLLNDAGGAAPQCGGVAANVKPLPRSQQYRSSEWSSGGNKELRNTSSVEVATGGGVCGGVGGGGGGAAGGAAVACGGA